MGISDASTSAPTIRKTATNTLVVKSSSSSSSDSDSLMEPSIPTSPLASSSSNTACKNGGSKAATAAAMADQQRMAGIEKAHNNDVLCGRGVTTNRHPGNMSFRGLVNCNKELYVTSTKKQKMTISRSIVDAVRARNPPGRFLEKDTATGLWFDIGDKKALEKTSQALRDGAAGLRKQLSEDLSDPDFLKAVFDDSGIGGGDKGKLPPMKHSSSRNARLKGPGHRRTVSDITSAALRSKPSLGPKRQSSMEIDHPTAPENNVAGSGHASPNGNNNKARGPPPTHSPSPSITASASFAGSSHHVAEQRKASRHNRAQSVGAVPYKVASLDLPSFDSNDFDWGAAGESSRRSSAHPGLAEVREHFEQFDFPTKLASNNNAAIPPRAPHDTSHHHHHNHRRSPSLPHAAYGAGDFHHHHTHHHTHHQHHPRTWGNGNRSPSPSYGGRPPPPPGHPGALSPGRAAAAVASRPPAFPVQAATAATTTTNNGGEGAGGDGRPGSATRRHPSYHHRHLTPPTSGALGRSLPPQAVSRDETASPSGGGDKTTPPVRVHTSPNHFESGKSFQFVGGKLKAVDSSPSSSNGPTLDLTDSPVVRTFDHQVNDADDDFDDDEDIRNESIDALERLDSFDLTPLPFEAESLELTDPLMDFHQQILSLPLTSPTTLESLESINNTSSSPTQEVVQVGNGGGGGGER